MRDEREGKEGTRERGDDGRREGMREKEESEIHSIPSVGRAQFAST